MTTEAAAIRITLYYGGVRVKRTALLRNTVSVKLSLSITHISRPDIDTDLDVGQAGQPAPHDDVARRWIAGSGEMAAEPRELGQIVR